MPIQLSLAFYEISGILEPKLKPVSQSLSALDGLEGNRAIQVTQGASVVFLSVPRGTLTSTFSLEPDNHAVLLIGAYRVLVSSRNRQAGPSFSGVRRDPFLFPASGFQKNERVPRGTIL